MKGMLGYELPACNRIS